MATFRGADIVPMPSTPAPKQIELIATDSVAVSTSPYTQEQQVQAWPGADQWTGSISLPQMNSIDVRPWEAWLYALRGSQNVFQVGHPLRSKPQGSPTGTPVLNGSNLPMATVLNTRGWTANLLQLHPGDHFQLGQRLHVCLDLVSADNSGNATFHIWPSLREAVPDGTAIQLYNAKGMFRLAENKRSVTTNESRLSAIQVLKIVEVR